jgi:hypothetical protein
MAIAGSCLSTMEKPCSWITTSPQSATFLYTQNTHKGYTGCLATFPLIVECNMSSTSRTDNIIAALGQSNRVCQVLLSHLASWQLEEVLAVMQVPFPELTDLRLSSYDETLVLPLIPDSSLDGSAPRLRTFLGGIPFPGLSNLLLSATHLVDLRLKNISNSGYISPESVLSSLRTLCLELQSLRLRPDRKTRGLPPPKPSVLPALEFFVSKVLPNI